MILMAIELSATLLRYAASCHASCRHYAASWLFISCWLMPLFSFFAAADTISLIAAAIFEPLSPYADTLFDCLPLLPHYFHFSPFYADATLIRLPPFFTGC
jgi:hypothetical protein